MRLFTRSSSAFMFLVSTVALIAPDARAADPTTADCLGASEQAIRLRAEHKLRDARAQLLVCAAATCPADVRGECERHVTDVNGAIPTIVFEVRDAAGAEVTAVRVTMDGALLVERLEGTAISLDPGPHTFAFEVPGQSPVQQVIVLHEGEKERHERISIGGGSTPGPASSSDTSPTPPPANPPPADAAAAPGGAAPVPAPATDASSSTWSAQKTWSVVLGGAGLVGLGVGSAFGLMALSERNDAQSACPGSRCATQDAANKWSSAGSTGNVSTIAFIVGGAGVAGAALLWFTAPSPGRVATQVVSAPVYFK
jgi:hypothetical protein